MERVQGAAIICQTRNLAAICAGCKQTSLWVFVSAIRYQPASRFHPQVIVQAALPDILKLRRGLLLFNNELQCCCSSLGNCAAGVLVRQCKLRPLAVCHPFVFEILVNISTRCIRRSSHRRRCWSSGPAMRSAGARCLRACCAITRAAWTCGPSTWIRCGLQGLTSMVLKVKKHIQRACCATTPAT